MDYKLSRKILWIGIDTALALLAASMCVKNEKLEIGLMIASVAAFALGILQAFLFYRCPDCRYSLIRSTGGIPEHCPGCGAYLSLEAKYENQQMQQEEKQEE